MLFLACIMRYINTHTHVYLCIICCTVHVLHVAHGSTTQYKFYGGAGISSRVSRISHPCTRATLVRYLRTRAGREIYIHTYMYSYIMGETLIDICMYFSMYWYYSTKYTCEKMYIMGETLMYLFFYVIDTTVHMREENDIYVHTYMYSYIMGDN